MSPTREDYLKIIYELGGEFSRVSNKAISEKLNISPPTVTEMTNSLVKVGWIEVKPYHGSILTKEGASEAKRLVHKHRLWEVFLVDKLGFSIEEVHDEAELLEHSTTDKLAKKLYEFLNHPKYCPHGGAILPEDMKAEDLHSEALTDIDLNVSVSISRFVNEEKLVHYFKNQNLNINDIINIKSYDKILDLYEIDNESNNETVYISSKIAQFIFVRK